jgi:cell division protein FtsB
VAQRLIPQSKAFQYKRLKYAGEALSGHTKRLWWMAACGFGLWLAAHLVFGNGGMLAARELDRQLAQTRTTNNRLERDLRSLQRDIAVRESDPSSYEKPAREDYRMMRDGEWQYLFDDDLYVPEGPWDPGLDGTTEAASDADPKSIRVDAP